MDVALEEDRLDRLGRVEPDVVRGDDRLQPRRDVDVESGADEPHAGIHVVRLPFVLAAAQDGEQRAALDERDAAAGEADAEAVEEAEAAAGEVGAVEDGVEAGGVAVARIAVAGRVEEPRRGRASRGRSETSSAAMPAPMSTPSRRAASDRGRRSGSARRGRRRSRRRDRR